MKSGLPMPKSAVSWTIKVNERELDTILAALRVYQTMLNMQSAVVDDVHNIASEHGEPMTEAEIDTLCENLNS